jgi:hypothetical protein
MQRITILTLLLAVLLLLAACVSSTPMPVYVTPTPESEYVFTCNNEGDVISIYRSPQDHTIVGRIDEGVQVVIQDVVFGNMALVIHGEQTGYVSSFRLCDAPPTPRPTATLRSTSTPRPTSIATRVPTQRPRPTPRPTATRRPGSSGCPNLNYSCSQLTCSQARACLRAGNTSLDSDRDGIPCESKCK